MDKKLTQQEYETLISQVETEFSALLAKAESETAQPLVKAEDEPKAEEAKDEKAEDKKEEKTDEEKKEEPKAEEKPAEEKKDEEACDYDDQDKDDMSKMYHSMSKAELGLHKEAVEKCYMAKCGEMQQMAKSEETKTETAVETKPAESSKEEQLLKSEANTLKKENDELKKNLEGLVASMEKFFTTKQPPQRKAISEIGVLAKSEEAAVETKELTKSEIHKVLGEKAKSVSLSKNDQDAIKNYYLNNAGIESVRHLLK